MYANEMISHIRFDGWMSKRYRDDCDTKNAAGHICKNLKKIDGPSILIDDKIERRCSIDQQFYRFYRI
jgi:hypothetical protein